jgi:RHS repeat-associated protein
LIYDQKGRLVKHINPNSGVSTATYNDFDDLISTESPNGNKTQYEYDNRGGTTAIIFANGKKVIRDYSKSFIRLYDEIGMLLEQKFDIFGRCIELRYGAGKRIRYIYDRFGRIVKEIGIGEGIREFTYDNHGQLVRFVNENGAVTTYQHNRAGLRIAITTEGNKFDFQYDKEGKLVKITNSRGEFHDIFYDLKGRMIKQSFFDDREELYEHDLAGAISRISDSSGRDIVYTKDPLGRPIAVKFSDGTDIEYEYTASGKIAWARRNGSEVEFNYDKEDRIIFQRQDDFEIFYEYDNTGKRIQIKDSHGHTSAYERDPRMRINKLLIKFHNIHSDQLKSLNLDFEYDRLDAVTSILASNGIIIKKENNGWKRPIWQIVQFKGIPVLEEKYEYNHAAQLVELLNQNKEIVTYNYNVIGQLLSLKTNGDETERYEYDSHFNIISKKIITPDRRTVNSFEYEKGNRLKTIGDLHYKYNSAGLLTEVIERNKSTRYFYSDDDLLTKVEHPNRTITEYEYDALRRRILKRKGGNKVTRFYWDIQTLWMEENWINSSSDESQEVLRSIHYIYDPIHWSLISLVVDGTEYLTFSDHIGTPQSLINDQGEVIWKLKKTAWGESLESLKLDEEAAIECPIRFPGQYADIETGLCYNMNRYYDPVTGRYTSPDPIGLLGGINTYTYTLNPVNYIDPLGLECQNFKDGEPPTLYRGDDRDPSDVCANGFQPANPSANISILDHAGGNTRGWVATSYDAETGIRFSKGKYVYIIDNPGCGVEIDCDPKVQERQEWLEEEGIGAEESEFEIAFKNVPAQAVTGFLELTPSGWTQGSC